MHVPNFRFKALKIKLVIVLILQALGVVDTASSSAGQTALAQATVDWTQTALAQAGLLMLQDCMFEEAFAVLARCGSATFQPSSLLQLFPKHSQRYR